MKKSYFSTDNEAVNVISGMNLEGNVIPHLWYQNIRLESDKPDLISIILLSEIVYWHRPTQIKDQYSGVVIGAKKKFKGDKLQRSYESFADQFGFSKRQVRESFIRLEKLNILKREFRVINTQNGPLSNVLYIDLNGEAVFHITYYDYPYDIKKSEGVHLKGTPLPLESHTYTEITTDIGSSSGEAEKPLKPEKPKPNLFEVFQQNLGVVSPLIAEDLYMWVDDFNGQEEIIIEAIRLTVEAQKNYSYTKGILKAWHKKGYKTLDQIQAATLQREKEIEQNTSPQKKKGKSVDWESLKKGLDEDEKE